MNQIYAVAKLGDQYLLMNSNDVPFLGTDKSMRVKTIKVDFRWKTIEGPTELENQLQWSPWEELDSDGSLNILQSLSDTFSDETIFEKIAQPLAENILAL